ncbi:hypothetical protein GIB67_007846 [Kingdonia uniflora]|uniref:Uncharacterized protein n=1 Tax=Kingdonia uniflora TaxID=39325 RepID=A0A7J7N222_9MAGN|nr:hypothetical protein GIB67_007846 [Kingdonia uniflora]
MRRNVTAFSTLAAKTRQTEAKYSSTPTNKQKNKKFLQEQVKPGAIRRSSLSHINGALSILLSMYFNSAEKSSGRIPIKSSYGVHPSHIFCSSICLSKSMPDVKHLKPVYKVQNFSLIPAVVSSRRMFPLFGKKYQLKFTNNVVSETHCLVHFPSLIRLAREAGLEYVEIQNLTEFYDDNGYLNLIVQLVLLFEMLRAQFAGMLFNAGPNILVDAKGKFLSRSFDILDNAIISFRLYTTFIFQKPDPDKVPPISTPTQDDEYIYEEVRIFKARKNGEMIKGGVTGNQLVQFQSKQKGSWVMGQ